MGTEFIKILTKEHRDALSKARKTYGTTNQILVSNEELCELAAVCAKYPRYSTAEKAQEALYDKALDEVADVLIVLDHIINIFDLKTPDLKKRVDGKVKRLQGWLNSSDNMEQTTIDRQVPGQTSIPTMNGCSGCIYEESKPLGRCKSCVDQSNYKKGFPCSTCQHMGNFKNMKDGEVCEVCVRTDGSMYCPKPKEG